MYTSTHRLLVILVYLTALERLSDQSEKKINKREDNALTAALVAIKHTKTAKNKRLFATFFLVLSVF
ncbi:hypothetical protein OKIT_0402 [Oenococcus kitaharae DSM 17330]|uniref:Uncharacterized protein n=1 Tax=Oenococcus kitaharae DSM 17330 TaxID=1045004 RepID=G9WJ74_9LACO|nr:hypothetical protein OKIT_0402 [Oenococcus kitaharae DSM 17330]